MLGGDGTDGGRGLSIAADRDVKAYALCLCPHPYVGGHRVEVKRATAIDREGNFWTNVGGERRCCNRATQVRSDGASIDRFLGIEARERIAQDRRTFGRCPFDPGHRCREPLYGVFRQSADLNRSEERRVGKKGVCQMMW